MSQNDFTIANQGFPAFRADLNTALQALASNNSGTSAPSTTFANMWWYDSANNIMYIRNEDNDAWIKFAELDQTNDKFILSGTLQLDDGSVSAPALTFNSDTNMGIYRGGTDILRFVTAGVDRLQISADGSISTPTSGTSNFRAGVNAGNSIVSGGKFNVLIGDEAGTAITTGDSNVAIGYQALMTEDAHGLNTAIGYQALKTLNAGAEAYNTGIGYNAGLSLQTGTQNTLIGAFSGDALTTGLNNVAVGYLSLSADTTGNRSVAIGRIALSVQNFTDGTNAYNVAVGYNAGGSVTTGTNNTLIGGLAGDALTDADNNTAVGFEALSTNVNGSASVAIGYGALKTQNYGSATDGLNVAVGNNAGTAVTTGVRNTIIGSLAGDALTDADYNIAVGYQSLSADVKGAGTVAIGYKALSNQQFSSTTQVNNTAVGYLAGQLITSGTKNTIIGGFNGNQGSLDIRTSSNAIVLSDGGGNPRLWHNSTTWRFMAASFTSALEFDGNQFYPLTDNAVKNGYPSNRWTIVYATTGTINTSDQELKQDIDSLSDAELRVATRIKGLIKKYRWKDAVVAKGDDARIHVGAIAQEVEQAFTDESLDADRYAIFCKDEWYEVDGKRAESLLEPYTSETENAVKVTRLGLRYDQLLAFVIATL